MSFEPTTPWLEGAKLPSATSIYQLFVTLANLHFGCSSERIAAIRAAMDSGRSYLNGAALEAELVSMQKAFNAMGTTIFKPE